MVTNWTQGVRQNPGDEDSRVKAAGMSDRALQFHRLHPPYPNRHIVRQSLTDKANTFGIPSHKEGTVANHWIEGAIKHPGAFSTKAHKAGMSTSAYANKESNVPGVLGHQARLAKTLMGMHHHADGCVSSPQPTHHGMLAILMPKHAMGNVSIPPPTSMGNYGNPTAPRAQMPMNPASGASVLNTVAGMQPIQARRPTFGRYPNN